MSLLSKVAALAGAAAADVVRVATHGGTTAADWDIARAIEQVTGRSAAETMWAGSSREARQSPDPDTGPANPHAVYDPQATVYAEDTQGQVTDTPEQDDADDAVAVEALAAQVYSDLDDLLRTTERSTARLVRSWTTPAQAQRDLRQVLLTHPRTRSRARHRALAHAA